MQGLSPRGWCVLGACSVQRTVGWVGDGSRRRVIYVPSAERSVGDVRVMRHILYGGCKGEVGKDKLHGRGAGHSGGRPRPPQPAEEALGLGHQSWYITSAPGTGWLDCSNLILAPFDKATLTTPPSGSEVPSHRPGDSQTPIPGHSPRDAYLGPCAHAGNRHVF